MVKKSKTKIQTHKHDLDAKSELRLNQVLFRDGEEAGFDGNEQQLLSNKKTPKESRIKKLSKENKALKQQVAKLKELLSTDKNLRQMKDEYVELFSECKQIVQHFEDKVQQTMLTEAVGAETAALMELLDQTTTSPTRLKQSGIDIRGTGVGSLQDFDHHLDPTKLNSMTMNHFELNFVQEINERVTQAEVLTVRDLKKIRSMLKFIYRQVMRLTSDKEPNE